LYRRGSALFGLLSSILPPHFLDRRLIIFAPRASC
jgi:hypothetical protein